MKKPAIFLDRDGVVIENRANYILSWDDVEIFESSMQSLAERADTDYLFVVVTNQSPVGRGLLPLEKATAINNRVIEVARNYGGRIDGAYICPHAPDAKCNCRKPNPGMLLQAAEDLNIDLSRSIMIGDALTDLEAGIRAGVGNCFMLMTGRGRDQAQLPEADNYKNILKFEGLPEALDWVFSGEMQN